MVAEIADLRGRGPSFATRLAEASTAVADLAAAAGRLAEVADADMAAVMEELTTLVGQLDGLRVAVTGQVRDRALWRQRGASSLSGWLRSDVRTADEAWALSRLAAHAGELPEVTGLLAEGSVSLAQAGAACWQITQLPDTVEPPHDMGHPEPEDELWAGLWRAGNVHAAADELFARYLPRLDAAGLRVLGAHLREAADAQARAGEDYDSYAARAVRLSRTLGGAGALSGHLHPEAAEQVIAAFEELGGKAGPEDTRTKAQRWADALVYLTSRAGLTPPSPQEPGASPSPSGEPGPDGASAAPDASQARPAPRGTPGPASPDDAEPDDDRPSPDGGHGHPAEGAPVGEPGDDQFCSDSGHGHDNPATPGHGHPAAPAGAHPVGGDGGARMMPAGLRRPRVIVTIPLASLLGRPLAPGGVLGAGTPITAEAGRRLACDAEIIRLITGPPSAATAAPGAAAGLDATSQLTAVVAEAIAQLPRPLGGPSAALDIGRKSQGWTPRQRDALHALYGGRCARPGCTRPIDVIHHVVHWLHGGKTKVSNGAPLCSYDHWLVHEGGWCITRQRDGILLFHPPPPGWRPGTIYRHGKPLPDTTTADIARHPL